MTDTPKRPGATFAFVLLFLLYFFDYADRMVITSLFPFLKEDWGLTDAQCALFVSAVYWSITLTTLPISFAVDRWSRRKAIAIMAIFWGLATGACAFARNFTQLFGARMAVGLGEAGYSPGGTAMLSGLYPPERRSLMMGIWNASIPLGAASGIFLGGFIAQHYGWRNAFGLVALPGLVVAFLFFFVKDYKTVELPSAEHGPGGPPNALKKWGVAFMRFARTPSLVLTYFGFAANTFVTTSLITWLPTFFHRTEGLAMDKAGAKGGAVMLLAIIGAPLGGYLTDRWLKTKLNARPLFAAIAATLTGLILFTGFAAFSGTVQYVIILAGGLAAVAYLPAAAAVTQDVVHPGLRAVSYSLCVIVQNLLGSSMGPIFVGAVSDAKGIEFALMLLPLFSILSGGLFFLASIFYVHDLNKVANVELSFEG